MNATAIEPRLRDLFAADPHGAAAVYLFGSTARGTRRLDSDVDLGVLFASEAPPPLAALDLEDRLERALGLPVQLVVLDRAPADLVHRVLRDGVLILDRDRSRRIRFEVRARQEYFDLLPVLRRYRRLPEHPA
ncbi:MAG TPA: nucleotidyltransferase domain-containing protein [Thermoanaerobaculia bacterium]|nr:nucleotidyltransferase domain-containing protein [Thermoanaerobaculia bacterium]